MSLVDFSLGDVGSVFTSLREAITGEKIKDPNEQARLMMALDELEAKLKMAQMDVNKTEAQHKSIFVAGWRPFIGWVSGSALAYNYMIQPLIYTALAAYGINVQMPTLEISTLLSLLGGMLGFGAFRTVEKIKGVERGY
jgi:hypothetical protein